MNKQNNSQNLELTTIEEALKLGRLLVAMNMLDTFEKTNTTNETISLRSKISNKLLELFDPSLASSKHFEISQAIYKEIQTSLPEGLFYNADKAFSLFSAFNYYGISQLATYFLKRAADLNHKEAQSRLAEYYYKGNNVEKDDSLAFMYMKMAADSEIVLAHNNLGYFYFEGIGTEVNYELAFKHMYKAYEMGETLSLNELGYMLFTGKGTEKNINLAYEIWNKGKALGDEDCIESLENINVLNKLN